MGCQMRVILGICFAVATAFLILAPLPANACNANDGNCIFAPGHMKGVPGPIAGAGLPVLAIGYGAYWLIKRRRKVPV
jgi:hypothetical protein